MTIHTLASLDADAQKGFFIDSGSKNEKPVKMGVYGSHDGKTWQYHPVTEFFAVNRGFPYVMTVDDNADQKVIKKPKTQRETRDKFDFRIGRAGFVYDATYTLKGMHRGKYTYSQATSGKTLLANMLKMHETHGCREFLVDDTRINAGAFQDAVKKAGLLKETPTPVFDATKIKAISLEVWIDRAYTWFDVTVDGVKVTDNATMIGLMGADFRTSAKETLGNGGMGFTEIRKDGKRGGWYFREVIDADKLAAWFDAKFDGKVDVRLNDLGNVNLQNVQPVNTDGKIEASKDDKPLTQASPVLAAQVSADEIAQSFGMSIEKLMSLAQLLKSI